MAKADDAVRNYLLALREPDALMDEAGISKRKAQLQGENDPIKRLQLQQEILEAQQVDPKQYEDDFVAHAKNWAESKGVTQAAFRAEGVSDSLLRRAGFAVRRSPGRPRGSGGGRTRVRADEVRQAIPRGLFTIADVQRACGASTAIVRRVVQEELAAGNVSEQGTDPGHKGPGRAPVLYKRP